MAAIVSSLVYTKVDRGGTPRTEAWLTCEFGEAYQGEGGFEGGIAFDLDAFFRTIEFITAWPVSGASLRGPVSGGTREFRSGQHVIPVPVVQDYGTPTSARFQLWGQALAILSGSPVTSGFGITQLVSGPAASISGIRFQAHVIGY